MAAARDASARFADREIAGLTLRSVGGAGSGRQVLAAAATPIAVLGGRVDAAIERELQRDGRLPGGRDRVHRVDRGDRRELPSGVATADAIVSVAARQLRPDGRESTFGSVDRTRTKRRRCSGFRA
jgi:hypothetical protein